MRLHLPIAVSLLFVLSAPGSFSQKPAAITASDLEIRLTAARNHSDADIAKEFSEFQLTERLTPAQFTRLSVMLPGDKSRQALAILADTAAFLGPPADAVLANPVPGAAELRRMIVAVVGYVNTTAHQLPNFVAARETTAFEDRPAEDMPADSGAGTISLSYQPVHFVARSVGSITYRDNREVVDGKAALKAGAQSKGLVTAGEFGPFLSTVLADAVKGKITWAGWVQGADGPNAVFHYQVAKKQSNYIVRFCCVALDASEAFTTHVFSQQAAYHGEIQFDPTTGAILRITAEAELAPGELIARAGMVVEYSPLPIGAKTVILPVRSVSLLEAYTARPRSGMQSPTYSGTPKTFLNDTAFTQYHQFRGEATILTGTNAGP